MSATLGGFQQGFFSLLLDPDASSALTAQPAFAVYRNTVMSACVDALQANFPTVARLVGTGWFRAAAASYVCAQPPRDGRMLMYGETFADYLGDFEPAREFPYLPGVAGLDRLWIETHTAADALAVDTAWLAQRSPEELGALRLRPHPATRWRLFDALPVYSIWAANRAGTDVDADFEWQGEGALLTRPVDAVAWQAIDRCGAAFLDACAQGCVLADAAGAALEVHPDADIADLLSRLLAAGALTGPSRADERPA